MITTHIPSLSDILSAANESNDPISTLKEYKKLPYVEYYLELAINDKWTTLDTTKIKFVQYNYHQSMAGARLLNKQTIAIFTQVIMNNRGISNHSKEYHFKALSEMLETAEAAVMHAILKKDITELYPNLTFDILNAAVYD